MIKLQLCKYQQIKHAILMIRGGEHEESPPHFGRVNPLSEILDLRLKLFEAVISAKLKYRVPGQRREGKLLDFIHALPLPRPPTGGKRSKPTLTPPPKTVKCLRTPNLRPGLLASCAFPVTMCLGPWLDRGFFSLTASAHIARIYWCLDEICTSVSVAICAMRTWVARRAPQ